MSRIVKPTIIREMARTEPVTTSVPITSVTDRASEALDRVERILSRVQCLNDALDGAGSCGDKAKDVGGRPALVSSVKQINDIAADILTVLDELEAKLIGT
jgi:hypothetical protein